MSIGHDVRHAVRLLRKSPGFALAAVVTLALGIAASTVVFTVFDRLLLRPMPYRDPARLLLVTGVDAGQERTVGCLTYPRFTLIAEQNGVFARIAAFVGDSANVTAPGDAEQVRAARVSPAFFDVLGVMPARGRTFRADDENGTAAAAVIISDELWHRTFGADPNVVGKSIALDGISRTVVGVLPSEFRFGLLGDRVDVWTPRIDELSLVSSEHLRSGTCYLNAVGRLADGVDPTQAQARMDVLNRRYLRDFAKFPDADPRRLVLAQPLQEKLVAGFRPMLLTIAGAVALLLLTACANVAGLLLARGVNRRRELAVRAALGATRANLVWQLLFESLVLAASGGLIGLLASVGGTRLLAAAIEGVLPRTEEIGAGVDARILWFAVAVSIFAGIAAGLAPALQVSRSQLVGILRSEDRGSIGPRRRTFRNLLVASQVGLSLVLLVAAGLLVRSFWKLQALDPGFEPRGTLTMNVSLPPATYASGTQMVDFFQRLLSKAEALPGIENASLASALPLNPSRMTPILAEGQPVVPLAERPVVIIQTWLGPYLRTMRIRLVRGRVFDERDRADSPPVVIVNQAFARRFFGARDPLGRHVVIGRRAMQAEIVGVVADVKNSGLSVPPAPEIDLPFPQLPWPSMNLTLRSLGQGNPAASPVKAAIASLDRGLPATGVQSMEEVLSTGRSRPRLIAALLGLFSLCALAVALVGIHGLIAYSVGQRTHELGVRMALGATRTDVLFLVVRQAVMLAGAGVAAGLAASFVLTRWLASMVYDVSTTDPLTFSAAAAAFLLFAAIAGWVPARRAASVDPCEALRG